MRNGSWFKAFRIPVAPLSPLAGEDLEQDAAERVEIHAVVEHWKAQPQTVGLPIWQ